MFTPELVLDDASGDDVTYRLVQQDSSGTRRIDITTSLAEPAILSIRHSTTGKGSDVVDRHLVQIARTKADSNGKSVTLTANFTLAVPRNTIITTQMVKDVLANMLDFLADGAIASLATTANLEALLRGES